MTLPEETVLTGAAHPGTELQILSSAAGYYLGFLDAQGAPYSRETNYMAHPVAAVLFEKIRTAKLNDIDALPA
jgi:hypothetical protein